jgi:diaminohydroxyphosphoribosylaminopyrimidine deaminase/5-amino-6-(5-phosphoribosylamino)uracil reductase
MQTQISAKTFRFIEIAEKIARSQSNGVQRHGAVIVKGGNIVGSGANRYTTGTHAEVCALGQGAWLNKLRGATIYIVRIRRDRRFGLSAPCIECQKMLRKYGIRKIYYTTNDINNPVVLETWP